MKRTILVVATVALVVAGLQNARAGEHEWALAGKVLTGVAAASAVGYALASGPVYYTAPACAYAPAPPVACAPPVSRVYVPAPAPQVYVAPPAPVVVYRAPVCVAPPVVDFRFTWGGGYHHRRACW